MKLIKLIRMLFKKRLRKYEVWDTSALSNHFDIFKKTLQSNEDVTLIIPEGVSHEISVGRKNNENCKEIYRFIEGNVRNPRLIVEVTPDNVRSWAVDEQVIYTTNYYHKKGYVTVLVTCDRDQSFRAKLKHLDVNFIPANKYKNESTEDTEVEITTRTNTVPVVVPVENSVKVQEEEKEISFPSKMIGKQCLLTFNKYISVYDQRGKRKIPKPEGVFVVTGDKVCYKNVEYDIKTIGANEVTLRQCNYIT